MLSHDWIAILPEWRYSTSHSTISGSSSGSSIISAWLFDFWFLIRASGHLDSLLSQLSRTKDYFLSLPTWKVTIASLLFLKISFVTAIRDQVNQPGSFTDSDSQVFGVGHGIWWLRCSDVANAVEYEVHVMISPEKLRRLFMSSHLRIIWKVEGRDEA